LKHFIKYLAFFTLLAGCGTEEGLLYDTDAAYFPLKKGYYQIYTVQDIRYSGIQVQELNYELMTVVTDSFRSADGQDTYVIHRSHRSAEGDPWEILDTWSARKARSEVIVSEGNTPFIKLKFPVAENTRWNGNAFNTLGEDEYEIAEAGELKEFNGMIFDQTITVEQEHNEDFVVYRDERREVYAPGVGLVYKESLQFNYCTEDHCLGQQKINEGIEMRMAIKEYGGH
jgi:hypothetical protein